MMESANNILMISGATPDSGKTFVSSTLAAVVAQAGQKVLYIDADMRRGYAHDLFKLDNTCGLSEMLSGKAEYTQGVQTFDKGGFDTIVRGQIPLIRRSF